MPPEEHSSVPTVAPVSTPDSSVSTSNVHQKAVKSIITLPIAIVTAAVIIAIALVIHSAGGTGTAQKTGSAREPKEITSVDSSIVTIRSTDHVYNDPKTALVTMYEYSDSDCPYCQQFHKTMKQVLAEYGTKVAWVYRYFPLSIHPDAYNEAVALECSAQIGGNAAFWKYLDSAFSVTVDPAQSQSILVSFAKAQGLDENLFKTCLAADSTKARIDSDEAEVQKIGAQGTPFTIVVNKAGKQVVIPGAYPFEDMKKAIDSLGK